MMRTSSDDTPESDYSGLRRDMVAAVAAMSEELNPVPDMPGLSQPVLDALGRVPRHLFVPDIERDFAYQNRPLPIGYGQTISQPYVVAFMTELLKLKPGSRVLEIGAGCGYQTAVLAEMGAEIYSIEIVEPLAIQAEQTLHNLGYDRVHVRPGDGYHGWPEHAPYDGIIVAAGASHVPQPLLDQLKPGGRMVIPLGESYAAQELLLIKKDAAGEVQRQEVLPVRFVPLTGRH
ncbi:protein-L-isoaspartate(D-aspartate) O-methyltransferase [Methylobacillus sp. MM3]|uniref:protein-L-isoaspartate(D-aspartate) O-methyltransferase n=1 Tax=Methylobacillus sp. MM3 TaxID=1848039 RepID=UPI000B02EFDE|nr:protein-L-isoaspartate(D-aspartate) O-methyltransferase [Methylobacillus sp. MM3]